MGFLQLSQLKLDSSSDPHLCGRPTKNRTNMWSVKSTRRKIRKDHISIQIAQIWAAIKLLGSPRIALLIRSKFLSVSKFSQQGFEHEIGKSKIKFIRSELAQSWGTRLPLIRVRYHDPTPVSFPVFCLFDLRPLELPDVRSTDDLFRFSHNHS